MGRSAISAVLKLGIRDKMTPSPSGSTHIPKGKHFVYVDYTVYPGKRPTAFYVGKGIRKRVRQYKRGPAHTKIVLDTVASGGSWYRVVVGVLDTAYSCNEVEIGLIQYLGTKYPAGANLTNGGDGTHGFQLTSEMLAERSVTQKEVQNRPEVQAKRSASLRAALSRPEVKARHREANKQAKNLPEIKKRQSERSKEIHQRPEVVAKKVASIREALNQDDVRERHLEALRVNAARPEIREKLSAAVKSACARPEVKAKKSASAKEASKRPGVKEAASNRMKHQWRDPEFRKMMLNARKGVAANKTPK